MNPEQLWETTMNPDNRVIVQITIDDAEKADEAFTILMGDQVEPRQMCIRDRSMEEIGREFSGRDHSTIVYSLKTMERDMKNDQHLRETVSDIIKNVKA